jgi:hypothetical protein
MRQLKAEVIVAAINHDQVAIYVGLDEQMFSCTSSDSVNILRRSLCSNWPSGRGCTCDV